MNKWNDSEKALAGDTDLHNRSNFLQDSDAPISSPNLRLGFHTRQWLTSGYSTLISKLALRMAEYEGKITIKG